MVALNQATLSPIPDWTKDGYGYGYGDGDGDGDGYGYGYGYGDGDGDGYGDGYGYGSYWKSCLGYFAEKWPAAQQQRLAELQSAGATIAYWRSTEGGTPANGGRSAPVAPGSSSSASDSPAGDSSNARHARSSRSRSCRRRSTGFIRRFGSGRSPERQIDSLAPEQGVMSRLEREDAVVAKAGRAAPDDHVTVDQPHAARCVAATQSPEQEGRRQSERDRDDGSREVALVPVLVE